MEKLLVVLSFILIFAFNSVDNSVAPLVGPMSADFGVSKEKALLLISICTSGTVAGLIFGPSLVASFNLKKLLAWCTVIMAVSQFGFALSTSMPQAMFLRAAAGLSSGLIASVMWHLTFHGVSKDYFPAMIAVLMSARPLATAIGVPAAGLMTAKYSWHQPIIITAILTTASGLILARFYPNDGEHSPEEQEQSRNKNGGTSENSGIAGILKKIVMPYIDALSVPYAMTYYIGSTINRMAYFGFYSFCGLWFMKHYGMGIEKISLALLIIGLADCLVNFITNSIIKKLGHRFTFLFSITASLAVLPAFIYGTLPVKAAIAVIAVFMTLDRIYSMALVISVPDMFPSLGSKTAFGSLNTLTAWGAMAIIAGIQGTFTEAWGMGAIETLLIVCFVIGSAMVTYIQWKTVFPKKKVPTAA